MKHEKFGGKGERVSRKGNRAYNSRKGAREGPGKASTVVSTWTAPTLWTQVELCGMSGTTWNHAFVAQLALACLQLWSFGVPVGLTALEIAVAAEFMKAAAFGESCSSLHYKECISVPLLVLRIFETTV